MIQTTENGQVKRFPFVCPHCDQTFWRQPNDLYQFPEACQEAVTRMIEAGEKDEGSLFWQALWCEAIERGKQVA